MARRNGRFTVIEFRGQGDPYFGGAADDRPLGVTGEFLTGCYRGSSIAEFPSEAAARSAANAATNRREGALLGVIPCWGGGE